MEASRVLSGRGALDDFAWTEVCFVEVGACDLEVELVEMGLVKPPLG